MRVRKQKDEKLAYVELEVKGLNARNYFFCGMNRAANI